MTTVNQTVFNDQMRQNQAIAETTSDGVAGYSHTHSDVSDLETSNNASDKEEHRTRNEKDAAFVLSDKNASLGLSSIAALEKVGSDDGLRGISRSVFDDPIEDDASSSAWLDNLNLNTSAAFTSQFGQQSTASTSGSESVIVPHIWSADFSSNVIKCNSLSSPVGERNISNDEQGLCSRLNQEIAEKCSDDVAEYSPKHSDDTNLQAYNNPSDETEHETRKVTDASFVLSDKSALFGLSSIATLEKVDSDHGLRGIRRSVYVDPIEDAASSSAALDNLNLNTRATMASHLGQQSTASTAGSETVLLPNISSAVCSMNVITCNSLSSTDVAINISNVEPGLFSRLNQTIAEKSSDDVAECSPKYSDVNNLETYNKPSDEKEHKTRQVTDASFVSSVKSAPFGLSSIAPLEKVGSDDILRVMTSVSVDPSEDDASFFADLDNLNLNTRAAITSQIGQKSTASNSASDSVILTNNSSADCSTNVFQRNSLSSTDGARNISNDNPDNADGCSPKHSDDTNLETYNYPSDEAERETRKVTDASFVLSVKSAPFGLSSIATLEKVESDDVLREIRRSVFVNPIEDDASSFADLDKLNLNTRAAITSQFDQRSTASVSGSEAIILPNISSADCSTNVFQSYSLLSTDLARNILNNNPDNADGYSPKHSDDTNSETYNNQSDETEHETRKVTDASFVLSVKSEPFDLSSIATLEKVEFDDVFRGIRRSVSVDPIEDDASSSADLDNLNLNTSASFTSGSEDVILPESSSADSSTNVIKCNSVSSTDGARNSSNAYPGLFSRLSQTIAEKSVDDVYEYSPKQYDVTNLGKHNGTSDETEQMEINVSDASFVVSVKSAKFGLSSIGTSDKVESDDVLRGMISEYFDPFENAVCSSADLDNLNLNTRAAIPSQVDQKSTASISDSEEVILPNNSSADSSTNVIQYTSLSSPDGARNLSNDNPGLFSTQNQTIAEKSPDDVYEYSPKQHDVTYLGKQNTKSDETEQRTGNDASFVVSVKSSPFGLSSIANSDKVESDDVLREIKSVSDDSIVDASCSSAELDNLHLNTTGAITSQIDQQSTAYISGSEEVTLPKSSLSDSSTNVIKCNSVSSTDGARNLSNDFPGLFSRLIQTIAEKGPDDVDEYSPKQYDVTNLDKHNNTIDETEQRTGNVSDDVYEYSPKQYDVTNLDKHNNTSDETEKRTRKVTDASFVASVKGASFGLSSIANSDKVESDNVLRGIQSESVDPFEDAVSSCADLDTLNLNTRAAIPSQVSQKSTAPISGSESVILPKLSSADCSTNLFQCKPLSPPDGARSITKDEPGLISRLFATDAPFSFKCVPNFSEATLENPDKTFTFNSSSSATTRITPSLSNPASTLTLEIDAPFSFKCVPNFSEAALKNPDKTFAKNSASSATTRITPSLSNYSTTPSRLPVESVQCHTALLDDNCASSSTAPNAEVKAKETYAKKKPDVVELCVGGTHRYTTSLATMTQAKAGTSSSSSSTIGISLVPLAGTDAMVINGTSKTFQTRMHVISGMDQFKHYSLEELRFFDGRLLETTSGFGLKTIRKNQQFMYPKGIQVEEQILLTTHMCITALKEYEDFSLEELRYADHVYPQFVKQLDHESHTYLNSKPTQTDTFCWPYNVKGFIFGLTGVEEQTTVNQKVFDDKTRQNQTIAEQSSDDVVGYSPKYSDVMTLENNNNRSDEAEHETKKGTDASFAVSVKSVTLEKVKSDDVLSRIKSMSVDPFKNADSSSANLDNLKFNTSAVITSEFDQQSTASISGSEEVILPKLSSADCSTNGFRCKSLASPDGNRNITNNKLNLCSRLFATGKPFSFKCVPYFGEATTRSPDKTFTTNSSSPATTWITPLLPNPASNPTHVRVTSVQCQTALLDKSCAISFTAPNVQVKAKESYAKESPDVVELFVGGTHRYTTLRAIMTQARAGDLAEMFLGKAPLSVMKDGAYFLDTDGESFILIIEYLRDGRLPDMDTDSMNGTSKCEDVLLKSFQTARKYGLLEYLHEIDQYGPIQRFRELEANKEIVEFYCKQILWALKKNDLEQNGKFAILLKSTNSTQIAAACCEHVCQFAPVDTVVYLTREFSLQILSLLCQRLRFLGYNVAANEESCLFRCSKHEERDTDKKECTSRRYLLMWFCLA